jgi:ATP-dependent DNA helicase RecQ
MEMAKQLGIGFGELVEELEQIINTGTKLNLKYFLNQFLDEDLQEEIFEYFHSAQEDNLEAAFNHFDGEFSHEELQLMRIQFLSDMGN